MCVWTVVALCAVPAWGGAVRSLNDLSGPWQLFVDDHLIASRNNVTRRYHAFKKHPANPLVVVDRPWEHNVVNATTVLPNETGDGFRMWYYCWSPPEFTPPGRHHGGYGLYAASADGLRWDKPNLGLITWSGDNSTSNNFVGASGSILHTPDDPDPTRRYKAIAPSHYTFRASPDGLRWETLGEKPAFSAGDTGHVMWDARAKKFRAYAKVNATVSGLRRRAIGYSESTGYEDWPRLRLIMAPDDFDDRWAAPGSVQRAHFYNCPVTTYETVYLGFLMIFRAEDEEGYFHGPMFAELVTSRDGVHWLREEGERPPILPCGPERTWDHGMVTVASLLVVSNELRLYYSGYDGLHDYLPFHAAIGLATLRKDGFVSLDGGDVPGEVTTKRLKGLKGQLRVNAAAAAGLLQVEVLDADGTVLPGYSRNDCIQPRGDGVDQIVTWRQKKDLPGGDRPMRLRFILRNVSLYSFRTDGEIEVLDEPAPRPYAALFTFEQGGGKTIRNALSPDGQPVMRVLGTSRLDRKPENAAFGQQSMTVSSQWRPNNALQIVGSSNALGTRFTLALMAKSTANKPARLFSAYNGNRPVNTSELVFDYDPAGRALEGLRLICKGIAVESQPVKLDDGKYHHLAVTYDDGHVRFYADGKPVGEAWLPGGAPVRLCRDLLVGEDAELGSDEQFTGNVDDVLVLGRVLSADDIAQLATRGGEAFFAAANGGQRR
ncbi:MAG: LamG domain-containing protein [Verrucomicrobiae bacterium]|nr:LamG domain-containing protein [Verrucomicrobiae bacterium]